MKKHLWFSLAGLGAAVGALAMSPSIAEAKWQRYNPAFCATHYGVPGDNAITYGGGLYGVINTEADWQNSVVCPIDDSSYFSKTEIVTLNVHVHDNTTASSNHARACTKNYNAFSYSCGLESKTTAAFTGHTTLTPEVSDFAANPLDFAYVIVTLAKANGTAYSSLHGYYTAD